MTRVRVHARDGPRGGPSRATPASSPLACRVHIDPSLVEPATLTHTQTCTQTMTSSRSAARGGIKSNPDLLSVSFNQDSTCIATGTRRGYTITNCDPFGKVYGRSDGATSIVEMLFCTSLVALVGAGDRPASSTRRLQIVNTKVGPSFCHALQPLQADLMLAAPPRSGNRPSAS